MRATRQIKPIADEKEHNEDDANSETIMKSQQQQQQYLQLQNCNDNFTTEDSLNTVSTSDVNTSQPSQSVRDNNNDSGDSPLNYQYDVNDHTTSYTINSLFQQSTTTTTISNSISNSHDVRGTMTHSCLPPHVMVIPHKLLVQGDQLHNTMQSQCLQQQKQQQLLLQCNTNDDRESVQAKQQTIASHTKYNKTLQNCASSSKSRLNAMLVKLPHPRHGQLVYFLVSSKLTQNSKSDVDFINSEHKKQCEVYELHAQRTASSFPYAWFIDNTVIPSRVDYMYVTSPFNVAYFTLRIVLQSRNMCDANTQVKNNISSNNTSKIYNECNVSNYWQCKDDSNSNKNDNDEDDDNNNVSDQHFDYSSFHDHNAENRNCSGSKGTNANISAQHLFVSKQQLLSSFFLQTMPSQRDNINKQKSCASANYKNNNYKIDATQIRRRQHQIGRNQLMQNLKQEWHGWYAMAQNNQTLQLLVQSITSHTQLAKFCDCKCVSFGSVTNTESTNACSREQYYYKFNKRKVVDWLVQRIHRLACSAVLCQLLRISPVDKNKNNNDKSDYANTLSSDKQYQEECTRRNKRQRTEAAFQLVMQYVDKCLHNEVAQACDLPCDHPVTDTNANIETTKCKRSTLSRSTIDEDKENVFDYVSSSSLPYKKQRIEIKGTARLARQSAQKSASVKRLEKAGKPANTPTLFEMFASKSKNKK